MKPDKNKEKKKEVELTYLPKIAEDIPKQVPFYRTTHPTRYEVGRFLGRGGFASCYHAVDMETKKQYALKIIDKLSQNMKRGGARHRLMNQIILMSKLKHENIIKIIKSFDDEHNYYLVLELCNKVSLNSLLDKRKKISQLQVKYYIRQLLRAVLYLKQMKIIHRDIKTPNILLDDNLTLKLGDFGLAVSAQTKDSHRYSICGTPSFMSPQIVNRQKYSYQIDMWSVGVVAYCLFYGVTPFGSDQKQTPQKIQNLSYHFLSSEIISAAAKNFISRIFVLNPAERLTPEQGLAHEFLAEPIPAQLPTQCYYHKVSTNQLLCFCKDEDINKQKSSRSKQNKKSLTNNRTISSYFPNNGLQKHMFKTNKKNRKNKNIQKKQEKQEQKIVLEEVKKQVIERNPQPQNFEIKINQSPNRPVPKPVQQKTIIVKKEKISEQDKFNPQNQLPHSYHVQQDQIKIQHQQNQQSIGEWLEEKLEGTPYIIQYSDQSEKFGIFYSLNNGVKVIIFNDKTSMALNQWTKQLVYIQIIDESLKQCEKLMIKLVQSDRQEQDNKSNSNRYIYDKAKTSEAMENKDSLNLKKLKPTKFKTHELPKNTIIIKKYFVLRDFCRNCFIKKNQLPFSKSQRIDLQQCATMITKWGCIQMQKEYIFFTKNYIHIDFADGTDYFVLKKGNQVLIVNHGEKFKQLVSLPLRKRKDLSDKINSQFDTVSRFLIHFIEKQRKQRQRKKLYGNVTK